MKALAGGKTISKKLFIFKIPAKTQHNGNVREKW
jgi:hypothetical protein